MVELSLNLFGCTSDSCRTVLRHQIGQTFYIETVPGRNPGAEYFHGVNVNNGSFQAARIAAGELPTKGVCTLVVPKLRKSAFLLRMFKILGAEGETPTAFCFTTVFTFRKNPNKTVLSRSALSAPSALSAFRCALVVTGPCSIPISFVSSIYPQS
jgi:hypothetical protein